MVSIYLFALGEFVETMLLTYKILVAGNWSVQEKHQFGTSVIHTVMYLFICPFVSLIILFMIELFF